MNSLAYSVPIDRLDMTDLHDLVHGAVAVDPTFIPHDGIGVVTGVHRHTDGHRHTVTLACVDGDVLREGVTTLVSGVYLATLRGVTLNADVPCAAVVAAVERYAR